MKELLQEVVARARRLAGLAAVVSAALVLVGSLLPGRDLSPLPNDKLLHILGYFTIATLMTIAVAAGRRAIVWGVALLCMGGAIELLQAYVPGRESSMLDMAANASGVVLGYIAGQLLQNCMIAWEASPKRAT